MKKKLIFFITLLVASVLFVPNAFAQATTPELITIGGREIFLANGTPITIEERTDGEAGALVKWDGGEQLVSQEVGIFGGKHNSTDKVDTSITMNGGTVRNIVGGGLHESYVGKATITVNGGKVRMAIYGGGYDGYVAYNYCETSTNEAHKHAPLGLTAADAATNSKVKVDEAEINLLGGDLDTVGVYGGGGGYSYTGSAVINTGNFTGSLDWIIGGGSNGHTEVAVVNHEDGEAKWISGINRGSSKEVSITVDGGTVDTIYAAASPSQSLVGTVEKAEVNVISGTVGTVSAGQKGAIDGTANATNEAATEEVEVSVNKNVQVVVENDVKTENVVQTVTLTFAAEGESESIEVPVDFAFTAEDVEDLEEELVTVLAGTGFKFDNFYKDADFKEVYDMTEPFTQDTTVYVKFVQLRQEGDGTTNPDTSDISLYGTIIAILLATAGLGYTIKKRRFN